MLFWNTFETCIYSTAHYFSVIWSILIKLLAKINSVQYQLASAFWVPLTYIVNIYTYIYICMQDFRSKNCNIKQAECMLCFFVSIFFIFFLVVKHLISIFTQCEISVLLFFNINSFFSVFHWNCVIKSSVLNFISFQPFLFLFVCFNLVAFAKRMNNNSEVSLASCENLPVHFSQTAATHEAFLFFFFFSCFRGP